MNDEATRPADAPAGTSGPPPAGDDAALRNLLLFLPRLVKMVAQLVVDAEVATADKLLLGAAVMYLASPIDLLPDMVPMLGQVDDIYLVALCLLRLMNRSGEAKLRQYWDGPEDIVGLLGKVTDFATRYLPAPLRTQIRRWVDMRSNEPPPAAGG
jgi:uncharacterized membrane protein YkvA (DUF1232 family)